MKPSRDELASRQGKPGRKRAHPVDVKPAQPPAANRKGALILVVLLIVVGASGGGWLMWQEVETLKAELSQSKQLLSESQTNLGDLQENIASQSTSLNKTGSKIQEQLDFHMSEIRKLWDLSNKANKPAINANEKSIADLKQGLATQTKQLAATESAAKESKSALALLESQLQQGELQTEAMNTQLQAMEKQLGELSAQNKALKSMLAAQQSAIEKLQASSGKTLQKTLKDITQRLDSIDAHRRQVNARLDQHDQSITDLYKSP